jgi:hypothetical protein
MSAPKNMNNVMINIGRLPKASHSGNQKNGAMPCTRMYIEIVSSTNVVLTLKSCTKPNKQCLAYHKKRTYL